MIRSLKFKNFQSFQDDTEVSFELPKSASSRGYERLADDGTRVSTVLAVFGANASGKTALLKSAAFLFWFMRSSFHLKANEPIAIPDRILNPNEPSSFEMIFDADGETWKYELRLNEKRVLWEALYKKQTRFSYLFKRTWNEDRNTYDVQLQSFDMLLSEAKKVRQNASLISTAIQYNSDSSDVIARYVAHCNVAIDGRPHYRANLAWAHDTYNVLEHAKERAVNILRDWDIGLDGIEISEEQSTTDSNGKERPVLRAHFTHSRSDGSSFRLPYDLESNGTQSAYVLLALLIPVLDTGGLAVIDEMESDLHPHLLESLLRLFDSEETNPFGAQLFFTSHTTKVLEYLGKSQTYFVEKYDCVSTAYRGDQIRGLRSDDNFRAKYEAGALGALPEVRNDA